jgi:hypothetical protein
VPAFAGTVFITIVQKKFYFFLEAFFLPPFFLDDFFLVAIVVDLHVELVRAQYIHKLKIASKGCVQFSHAESDAHHAPASRRSVVVTHLMRSHLPASDSMNCHSDFVTGVIDSRLPRFKTTMSLSLPLACERSSSSAITRSNLLTSCTST